MYSELVKVLNELANESSKTGKQKIIKEHKDLPYFKDVLEFLTNPFKVSGISTKKIEKDVPLNDQYDDLKELIDYIVENNTGKDNDLSIVKAFVTKTDPIFADIFAKNLKLGVSAKSVNQAFDENLVPTFDVQLAYPYDKVINKTTGTKMIDRYNDDDLFVVTQKLDGFRAITVINNGIKTYSRKGQEITGLDELHTSILDFVEHNQLKNERFILDGELLLRNDDGLSSDDLFRATSKVLKKDQKKENIEYNIFDILGYNEFMFDGQSKNDYLKRRETLNSLDSVTNINIVKDLATITKDEIPTWSNIATENGWEGVMLNYINGKYEAKRTPNLLKVKKMHTADLEVVGFKQAIDGRFKGGLQSIIVQFEDNQVDVGSGLTDELREEIWANQEKYLGQIVEVQYFEISENQNGKQSLRFPVFKDFRFDKTKEDINIE